MAGPDRRVNRVIAAVVAAAVASVMLVTGGARSLGAQAVRTEPLDRVVAVVGSHPILLSEAIEAVNAMRQQGQEMPRDSAGQYALLKQVVNQLVDNKVVEAVAKSYKAAVTDDDVAKQVEDQYTEARKRFASEAEFRAALRTDGFGTAEDYRRTLREQAKNYKLQQAGFDSLRAHGRLAAPVQVTEDEVSKSFAAAKDKLPKRPATIAFRQIVIAPRPSPAARAAAFAKAESLLVQLKNGADFATLAKRESMDPGSRDQGGDLGWARRGSGFVPEFERVIFSPYMKPGDLSDVVETAFGFHIIRVDRVQPGEVKSRHILIAPKIDSADVARTRLVADTVLKLWKAGASYDSLAAKYHDPAEVKTMLDGFEVDKLPDAYKPAIEGVGPGQFTKPFDIPDPRTGEPKIGILQIVDRKQGGDFTVADYKDRIRTQLIQEKQIRRALDQLRKEQYVRVLFDEPATATAKPAP